MQQHIKLMSLEHKLQLTECLSDGKNILKLSILRQHKALQQNLL